MAIPYRTAKFKSANIFAMAIWGPTAKFNSRQYFRLYGNYDDLVNLVKNEALSSKPFSAFAAISVYCISVVQTTIEPQGCDAHTCTIT